MLMAIGVFVLVFWLLEELLGFSIGVGLLLWYLFKAIAWVVCLILSPILVPIIRFTESPNRLFHYNGGKELDD